MNSSEVLPCGVRVHYQPFPGLFPRYRTFIGGKTYGVVVNFERAWAAVPKAGKINEFDTRAKAAQYLYNLLGDDEHVREI